MANITGWGRGTWSSGAWGEAIPVELTGVSATGAVGSVSVVAEANVPATGLQATGNVGSVTVSADANVAVTGEAGTTGLGSVTVVADANVAVTGVSSTGQVGSVTVTADANAPVTGLQGTMGLGSVVVQADANVAVTGIAATVSEGSVTVTGDANVPASGLSATGGVGSVTVSADANFGVTGVSARAAFPAPITFSGSGDAQISTAQSKFGGASLLLDGSGDYLESQETYNFSGDPFTIDMWVRPASGTQDAVFFDSRDSTSNNALALRQATDNLLVVRANGTLFNVNGVFSANTWVHIAVTRGDPFGNTYSVFVDGVKVDSTLFGTTATAANIHIGSDFNGSNNWAGYLDELRISNVDRYDGNSFTPPSSAYTADNNTPTLLHFDGADGSTTFTNDGFVQAVTVEANADVAVTGIAATGQLGTVDVGVRVTVPVTGLQASANLGNVTVAADANVALSGVSAAGQIGNVFIWSQIIPSQTPSWGPVGPSQTPNWTNTTPSQTPNWTNIAA